MIITQTAEPHRLVREDHVRPYGLQAKDAPDTGSGFNCALQMLVFESLA